MLNLFSNSQKLNTSTLPRYDRQDDILRNNIRTVKKYTLESARNLNSSHPLVKLTTMLVSSGEALEDWLADLEANKFEICATLRLTTYDQPGTVQDTWYHPLNTEYAYATFSANPFDVYDHWEDAEPIVCMKHDMSDVRGSVGRGNGGISIWRIDLVALTVQVNQWVRNEKERHRLDVSYLPKPIPRYCATYCHMSILRSHMAVSLLNRYLTVEPDEPRDTPYHLVPSEVSVDRYHEDLRKHLDKNTFKVSALLQRLKLYDEFTAIELLTVSNVVVSKQVSWLFNITQVDYLLGLVALHDITDTAFRNDVYTTWRRWKSSKSGQRQLGPLYSNYIDTYETLTDLVG